VATLAALGFPFWTPAEKAIDAEEERMDSLDMVNNHVGSHMGSFLEIHSA
jgi:hypothetical protein